MSARLSPADALAVATVAVDDQPVLVRDAALLDSALHRPYGRMLGTEAYPGLFTKAAALLQSLAINHPLVDGNKRTAWIATAVLLRLHGVSLRTDTDTAERLVVSVAAGETRDVGEIADVLRELAGRREPAGERDVARQR
ncbi:type II toxin-antitoxin system death-on-curing family toxin [Streptomyces evansiae]|uniref:type II toxin-antitoxin system death-on-curing family toxin n=1 Tax=Streptomyces evansiae TaxID=3075535 RepID=UPI00288721F7|nr:type II toxin-antitoxin system death-on-curing family toxin [Streptomyces sp. DSM 41859]MDT0425611.1 type II toxin-antitoxin system death-on-curing family toxin [Streptomyces sp. DSM 41859]